VTIKKQLLAHEMGMTVRHQQTMNKKLKEVLTSKCSDFYWEQLSLDSVHEIELKQESTNRCSQPANLRGEHEDENSILSSCLFLSYPLVPISWVGELVCLQAKNITF
jgi:hypothetical protein